MNESQVIRSGDDFFTHPYGTEELCHCEDAYFKFCGSCGVSVLGCSCGRMTMGSCVYCNGKPRPEQEKKWYGR